MKLGFCKPDPDNSKVLCVTQASVCLRNSQKKKVFVYVSLLRYYHDARTQGIVLQTKLQSLKKGIVIGREAFFSEAIRKAT